jgi:hypothetical protein
VDYEQIHPKRLGYGYLAKFSLGSAGVHIASRKRESLFAVQLVRGRGEEVKYILRERNRR